MSGVIGVCLILYTPKIWIRWRINCRHKKTVAIIRRDEYLTSRRALSKKKDIQVNLTWTASPLYLACLFNFDSILKRFGEEPHWKQTQLCMPNQIRPAASAIQSAKEPTAVGPDCWRLLVLKQPPRQSDLPADKLGKQRSKPVKLFGCSHYGLHKGVATHLHRSAERNAVRPQPEEHLP